MVRRRGRLSVIAALGILLSLSSKTVYGTTAADAVSDKDCRIFLVPGAFGSSTGGANLFIHAEEYFADYREFFRSKGCRVGTAEFPPDATIEVRSLMLRDQMRRFADNHPVVLIAHSQGGLDARFALKTLKLTGVRSLVTIGTPHMGTGMADWVVHQRDAGTPVYWFLRIFASYDLRALGFAAEMTGAFLNQHAALFERVPGVLYGSAQGLCTHDCYWGLRSLAWWVKLGPGDGMVPAASQHFGSELGEYNLDHLSEVGADAGKHAERQRLLSHIWDFLQSPNS